MREGGKHGGNLPCAALGRFTFPREGAGPGEQVWGWELLTEGFGSGVSGQGCASPGTGWARLWARLWAPWGCAGGSHRDPSCWGHRAGEGGAGSAQPASAVLSQATAAGLDRKSVV